jgi:hypothetical protein
MLGRVYAAKGLPDRAVGELERARALLGPRPDVVTSTAYVLARAGRTHELLATLDELRRISKPRDPSPFRIASVHIGLGETDRAFEWLEKAFGGARVADGVAQRRAALRHRSVGSAFCCASGPRRASTIERLLTAGADSRRGLNRAAHRMPHVANLSPNQGRDCVEIV